MAVSSFLSRIIFLFLFLVSTVEALGALSEKAKQLGDESQRLLVAIDKNFQVKVEEGFREMRVKTAADRETEHLILEVRDFYTRAMAYSLETGKDNLLCLSSIKEFRQNYIEVFEESVGGFHREGRYPALVDVTGLVISNVVILCESSARFSSSQ